jgi:hypothetical protein
MASNCQRELGDTHGAVISHMSSITFRPFYPVRVICGQTLLKEEQLAPHKYDTFTLLAAHPLHTLYIMRSCSLFLVVLTMFLTAAPVMSNCPPKQFCSRCPRTDNAGHSLQGEPGEAGYVHCQYKDTDCRYGPRSEVCCIPT